MKNFPEEEYHRALIIQLQVFKMLSRRDYRREDQR